MSLNLGHPVYLLRICVCLLFTVTANCDVQQTETLCWNELMLDEVRGLLFVWTDIDLNQDKQLLVYQLTY